MWRFMLVLTFSFSLWAGKFAYAQNLYMKIDLMKGSTSNFERANASAGCRITPGGTCDGLFWISENESGVTSGGLTADIGKPAAEFIYQFGVRRLEKHYQIAGTVFNLFIKANGDVEGGKQHYIEKTIMLDKQMLVETGEDRDGNPYLFSITVSETPIPATTDETWNGSKIVLLSRQMVDGHSWSVTKNSRNALEGTTRFNVTFSSPPNESANKELKYQCVIEFSDLPTKIDRPFNSTVNIERRYNVRKRGLMSSSSSDLLSRYSKAVVLRPGKLTELVIPPDTPSVDGFNILDTLRIFPAPPQD